jgi:hypothetical protein
VEFFRRRFFSRVGLSSAAIPQRCIFRSAGVLPDGNKCAEMAC